jgi:formyl-CoA transferase
MSASKVDITASPLLGEHTDDILSEVGYETEQISSLHTAAVL